MKQTISSQEQLISILKSSLKEANISPAGKLKNDDEQTQFTQGLIHMPCLIPYQICWAVFSRTQTSIMAY